MSGKTQDGNKWSRRSLCQAAWAVTRQKNCYLSAQFKTPGREAGCETSSDGCGPHDANHRLPQAQNGQSYHELGGDYLERINEDQLQRYFVKRLQRLGLKVTVEAVAEAA
jgi:hypothetical protein